MVLSGPFGSIRAYCSGCQEVSWDGQSLQQEREPGSLLWTVHLGVLHALNQLGHIAAENTICTKKENIAAFIPQNSNPRCTTHLVHTLRISSVFLKQVGELATSGYISVVHNLGSVDIFQGSSEKKLERDREWATRSSPFPTPFWKKEKGAKKIGHSWCILYEPILAAILIWLLPFFL